LTNHSATQIAESKSHKFFFEVSLEGVKKTARNQIQKSTQRAKKRKWQTPGKKRRKMQRSLESKVEERELRPNPLHNAKASLNGVHNIEERPRRGE